MYHVIVMDTQNCYLQQVACYAMYDSKDLLSLKSSTCFAYIALPRAYICFSRFSPGLLPDVAYIFSISDYRAELYTRLVIEESRKQARKPRVKRTSAAAKNQEGEVRGL